MSERKRIRIFITGVVQGVGFRPFIYRLAKKYDLTGFINNSSQGVLIEAEGDQERIDQFIADIDFEKPEHAFIQNQECTYLELAGFAEFIIQPSSDTGEKSALILPDIATCPDCLKEIFDPGDRRYLYPFTNCTLCGPRFTIIESLPYDRPNTTMKFFPMCDACKKEYTDPENRRFHAQPNACPVCGPHVMLWNDEGYGLAQRHEALEAAVDAIRNGKIVAVKGIGGFHLMADARSNDAVRKLRNRKRREEKPFALMAPSMSWVELYCEVTDLDRRLLKSPQSPIVLLRKNAHISELSDDIAPGNPYLGIMLPYSPLHHILMKILDIPVIATSGNLSDEPICIDELDALARLNGIADYFLVHNRPIVRHVDDSIVRIIMNREMIIRRARGYAPLPVILDSKEKNPETILAVGAHLKNTIAVNQANRCFISQHIGDLDNSQSVDAFEKVIGDLRLMYDLKPSAVVSDLHPDYASTRFASSYPAERLMMQHHLAHTVSCMTENDLEPPVLGVSWDGTGYGDDGTVWGGEFLLIGEHDYRRVAHFRQFMLPGGDQAVKEPRRSALGILYEIFGRDLNKIESPSVQSFSASELSAIETMLFRKLNSVYTSSAGRLFDAVASLIDLRQKCRYEGQAAMELEFISGITDSSYPFQLNEINEVIIIDWEPMIRNIMTDYKDGVNQHRIATQFHRALSDIILSVAKKLDIKTVALSGGCFQNKLLLESAVNLLQKNGFKPFWHQRIPTNDGGISLGQIATGIKYGYLLKKMQTR